MADEHYDLKVLADQILPLDRSIADLTEAERLTWREQVPDTILSDLKAVMEMVAANPDHYFYSYARPYIPVTREFYDRVQRWKLIDAKRDRRRARMARKKRRGWA